MNIIISTEGEPADFRNKKKRSCHVLVGFSFVAVGQCCAKLQRTAAYCCSKQLCTA